MRKKKRIIALAMAAVLTTTSVVIPNDAVEAQDQTKEYVVMAKNDIGYEKAESLQEEEIVQSEELENNNVLVAEFTANEVRKLEKDKNILMVEEDIQFEASDSNGQSLKKKSTKGISNEKVSKKDSKKKDSKATSTKTSKEKNSKDTSKKKSSNEKNSKAASKKSSNEKNSKATSKKLSQKKNIRDTIEESINLKKEREKKNLIKEQRDDEMVSVDAQEQWNIDVINANEQEYNQVNDKVKVAVMDTGITATEDIAVTGRVNFIDGEEDVNPLYEDMSGHGTSVASIIAAKENDIGVTGVNPNVELYSVKVLDDNKKASLSGVVEGIYWCIENNIDIINMSFGTNVESEILEQVIQEADDAGILMIAAAGNKEENESKSVVEYPAAFDEVIAVGATNPKGEASDISSEGAEIELMAPGEKIPATGYFDEVIETEGTSMAAPHITGVASVLWAKDRSKSSDFIRELMNASAKSIGDEEKQGNGVVDLEYALTIYDEFADSYVEDDKVNGDENLVKDNAEALETYTDAEVEASWHYNDHAAAIGTFGGMTSSDLNIVKIGAKLPDTASYLKYSSGSTDSFHGHYNYIANYMYVMRLARACQSWGLSEALRVTAYPGSGQGYSQIYYGMLALNNNWNSVLAGRAINNYNKALVLVGIATHIAMDTYAHKAYLKGSSGYWNVHISGDAYQDSTSYVPARWTCAKNIAYDILYTWAYGYNPDGWEFYQSSHGKNQFRLFKFATYMCNADEATYDSITEWLWNRTSD